MPNHMTLNSAIGSIQAMRAHLDELAGRKRKLDVDDIDDPLLFEVARSGGIEGWEERKVSVKEMRDLLGQWEEKLHTLDKDGDEKLSYAEAAHMTPLMSRVVDRATRTSGITVEEAKKGLAILRDRFETVVGNRRSMRREEIEDPALLLFANYGWTNRSEPPPSTASVSKMRRELDRLERKLNFVDMDHSGTIGHAEAEFLGAGLDTSKLLDILAVGVRGPTWSEEKLERQAAAFVVAHSQDGVDEFPGVEEIYPRLNDGEDGLHFYTFPDEAAKRLMAFTRLDSPNNAELAAFDPAKHMVFGILTTGDELSLIVNVIDRASGESKKLDELYLVEAAYHMSTEDFEGVLGPLSNFNAETPEEVEQWDLSQALLEGAKRMELPAPWDLTQTVGVRVPFDPTRYDGWGNEPDLAIFPSPIATAELQVKDLGTLVEDGHYNAKLYEAGLTRDNVKAVYQEMKRSCPDCEPHEFGDFELHGVRTLYDEAGLLAGHEVSYGDPGGAIGASVYITPENVTTYGLGS